MSQIDPHTPCKQGVIVVVCVDNCCIVGTSKELIESFVMSLRWPDKKSKSKNQQFDDGFDFTVEDSIEKFLAVETHRSEGKACMHQPHLIERVIDAVGFADKLV